MSRSPVFISVILILLALIASTHYFGKMSAKLNLKTSAHHYDMFSNNMSQIEFNADGLHSSTSHFSYLTHYPVGNYILAEKPHIITYNKDSPWFIDADHAKNMEDSHTTYFIGHVVMTQPATQHTPKTVINTTHGTLYSLRSFALTNAPVSIDRGNLHVTSKGATADLKKGIVNLLSETRGHGLSTQQAPYSFSSDSLTYDNKAHTLTYTGHVKIDQETTHISGDKLIIYLTAHNKMTLAVDTGHPATYTSASKTIANKLKATASTITYNPNKQLIYLDGHAFVTQNHNTISASHIIYDKARNIVYTHHSTEQPLTHIIVMPKKTPPSATKTSIARKPVPL